MRSTGAVAGASTRCLPAVQCVPHHSQKPTTAWVVRAAPVTFEPQIDSQALTAQLVVLSATAATAAYWWLSVVPSARRTLAKEKRSGPLNQYLVELQSDPSKRAERWFYTDWLQQLQRRQQLSAAAAAKRASTAQASGTEDPGVQARHEQQEQQQQVSEALSQQQQQQQPFSNSSLQQPQQESPAEPGDKMPSFWSLDNPILATGAMLAGIALLSSMLHR